jgi:lipoyl(octanoyl) transferase
MCGTLRSLSLHAFTLQTSSARNDMSLNRGLQSGLFVNVRAEMTITTCRILPYEIAEGAANMALDEALLELVARVGDVAYLRTYGWAVPTLSLGYFQHLAEAGAEPRWRGVPLVRRSTGGGAIWHHHELTYALAVPARHPLARPHPALYRAVHSAVAETLREEGVDARRRCHLDPASETAAQRPFLCFTDRDPEDIVSGDIKIVGSAQRRRAGAVLQHGSVLLKRSTTAPELAGVCDLADVPGDPAFWSNRILQRIPVALGLKPVCHELPAEARERAGELKRTTYGDPAWTLRR